jgi:spore germination protein GerM
MERLLTGSANADITSAIPAETKLNKLTVQTDGVHIDLNQAFTTGGGSASMQGRLGQVIYTASSLNPQEKVWLSIEGEPLEVLGGEGLLVSQPMTRQEFDQEFSL